MTDSTVQADLFVILGATGDLAQRMLFPSLYFLDADGFLPPGLKILGSARGAHDREAFLSGLHDTVAERAKPAAIDPAAWSRFSARVDYCQADAANPEGAAALRQAMGASQRPVFYLALSPSLFAPVCASLKAAGVATPLSRVVLEKPVGHDLASSRVLNDAVADAFSEDRVFRIDHYLGKETVQNLLALRFANTLFEPLWNNLAIDHVEITVAETAAVGDRWPYYDEYGALRDMLQNHMLQLLCLVAMEPPSDLDPESVRNEKVKVLRSLRPFTRAMATNCTVRGQYGAGVVEGQVAPAYETERGQPSTTETFVALRADVDNWRWAGVPFFLRTGKRLPERRTRIVIQFKGVPHSIFGGNGAEDLIAERLRQGLGERGEATLAASGGQTPARTYQLLQNADLAWKAVTVVPTDERWVPPTSPESNEGLLRRSLLVGEAGKARLLSLWSEHPTPGKAAACADLAVSACLPFDVALLGMGEDGHVASLFPGSPALEEGLDLDSDRICIAAPVGHPAPSLPRLSLTLRALLDARLVVLLISGEAKRRTLRTALGGADLPVRRVLDQDRTPVRILWAP